MLVSFSVSNFRSFYEEATLNMVASNKLSDHPEHRVQIGDTGQHVVRAALIYGANAAGKSNLVKAMEFAQRLIRGGHDRVLQVEHFRFHPNAAKEPSSFEFRFVINDRVFVYGFDLLTKAISNEWLAVRKGDDEVDIFVRDRDGKTTVGNGIKKVFADDMAGQDTLDSLAELKIRGSQLFLSRVIDLPSDVRGVTLNSVIWWLTECLTVMRPEHRFGNILEQLQSDEQFKTFSSQFLEKVGTGIDCLEINETERDASEFQGGIFAALARLGTKVMPSMFRTTDSDVRVKDDEPSRLLERQLVTKHKSNGGLPFELPFGDESDGTQQLLHLMPVLYSLASECKVVVVDELDRSLHPLLCWEFVRFFSESCPGACKQLIVTTHESHLLNQELLRRDEYWFVEKDATQQSRLVPLSEFSIRNDMQVQKGYLQGRFGAIPVIGSLDALQQLLECNSNEAT